MDTAASAQTQASVFHQRLLGLQNAAGNRAVYRLLQRTALLQRNVMPPERVYTVERLRSAIGELESFTSSMRTASDAQLSIHVAQLSTMYDVPHYRDLDEAAQRRMHTLAVAFRNEVSRRVDARTPRPITGWTQPPSVSAGTGGGRALTASEIRQAIYGPSPVASQLREIAAFGPIASIAFTVTMLGTNDVDRALDAGRAAALSDLAVGGLATARATAPAPRPGATEPVPMPRGTPRPAATAAAAAGSSPRAPRRGATPQQAPGLRAAGERQAIVPPEPVNPQPAAMTEEPPAQVGPGAVSQGTRGVRGSAPPSVPGTPTIPSGPPTRPDATGPAPPNPAGLEFTSARDVRAAVITTLRSQTTYRSQVRNPNISNALTALSQPAVRTQSPANARLAELVPIVWRGVRQPSVVADVMAEVWREAGQRGIDYSAAVISLSSRRGPVVTIPSQAGTLGNTTFFRGYAMRPARIIDRGQEGTDHGVLIHMVQDLIVDRVLERAQMPERAGEFRALLRGARGDAGNVPLGDAIWRGLYDVDGGGGHINEPETLSPLLNRLFGIE